jgi:hypothetical protein
MAILVDFEKVREDSLEVEYAFGFPEMDRRMVIAKESREARPADGLTNLLFQKAYGAIIRGQTEQGTWPEKGGYAA